MIFGVLSAAALLLSSFGDACSDAMMNFSNPQLRLSVRTMDLGSNTNWTITSWPAGGEYTSEHEDDRFSFRWTSKYNAIGVSGNWLGDDKYEFPSFFGIILLNTRFTPNLYGEGDGINEKGLSCGLLTLVGSEYEEPSVLAKYNIFFGTFCQWVTQSFADVSEVAEALEHARIWGPEILSEHFVMRDAKGMSLVVELINGKKKVYLDANDGVSGFGIMTNEPTFDWHLTNIEHYEWKRTLARQAVEVPGGWYPEDRYLRMYMVKQGMQNMGLFDSVTDFDSALSLCAQVLNVVTVPMGYQYATDTGDNSGEGSGADHTMWAMVRDHSNPAIYWRDQVNPTFRQLRLSDIDFSAGVRTSMVMETGPSYIDMSAAMHA